MEAIFIQLAVILLVAFVVSYIARAFNQPLIIGYIIAGMIISPFILNLGASQEVINIFSEIGIAFLLFIVGLHLNPRVIREIGFSSLVIAIIQMAVTFGIGYVVASAVLGFGSIASIYIGIALAFSSTIIIMKLLSDKRQLDSLYGKISIGILITQDLAAILALIIIPSLSNNSVIGHLALKSILSGGSLVVFLFLTGFFVLPKAAKHIAKSQELLFLFSICWCFVVAAAFSYLGFSIEIGALIAGVALSISPYSSEISAKIRPLRDFFLIIFFIILGLNIPLGGISAVIANALILSVIVLIFKPLILMALTGLFGYTKRTTFFVGTTLAQISEFSLIVVSLGAVYHSSAITPEVVSTIILTLVLTILFSTYLIMYSNSAYKKMAWFSRIFERKKARRDAKKGKDAEVVLFGYNRIGFSILEAVKKIKKKYIIVDFNPDTISILDKSRVPCLYGDVYDSEFLEDLPLAKLKIAASTIPDYETNEILIAAIRAVNPTAVIIVRAHDIDDALELYKKGADYVLTPHFLGGDYVANMVEKLKSNKPGYTEERKHHIKTLEERKKLTQKHPDVEKD